MTKKEKLKEVQSSLPFVLFPTFVSQCCHDCFPMMIQFLVFLEILSFTSYIEKAGTMLGCCFKNVVGKNRKG